MAFAVIRLDHAFQEIGQAVETPLQAGARDGFFRLALLGEEDAPTGGAEPMFIGHRAAIAAVTDPGLANQEIGQLYGRHEPRVLVGVFRCVMEAGSLHEHIGQIVIFQIEPAEFTVINSENGLLERGQFSFFCLVAAMDFCEMIGER